jgi:tryptophan synthase alpha chain
MINLMTHFVAGYPAVEESILIGKALIDAGSKYIEVQFPFLDPIADGPVIKNACKVSVMNGLNFEKYFYILDELNLYNNGRSELVCMSYYNPVMQFKGNFIEECIKRNVEKFIIPDLMYGEVYLRYEIIPVISTLVSPEYFMHNNYKSEIVYCVSGFGVTGQTVFDVDTLRKYMTDFKNKTGKKVYLGFGIKSLPEAESICKFADGAVIGSQIIREYEKNGISALHTLLNIGYK